MGIIPESVLHQFYQAQIRSKVTPRNVHCDMRSEEKSTGVIKKKFKLLAKRQQELGIYFFYALTTTKEACPARCRVEFHDVDYETRDATKLSNRISYINIEKVAVENTETIIQKLRDSRNGFEKVGLIRQYKYNEIKSYESQIRQSSAITADVKEVILGALSDTAITTDFVNKFGI